MEKKEKILFIINPKSGTTDKGSIPDMIAKYLTDRYDVRIEFTNHKDHATELARMAVTENFQRVVAVGGDGTMNEVAKALVNTPVIFGIIPCGSGNGLARHLGIPLKAEEAIRMIAQGQIIEMDSVQINEKIFFCTAGIGFDARISKLFDEYGTRGFFSYVKISFREFFNYKPEKYLLKVNGMERNIEAFLMTFANTAQYGNNAYISPLSDVRDGKMEITIIKPFPKILMPDIVRRLFRKTLHTSSYVETISTQEFSLIRKEPGPVHADGEPSIMPAELKVKVIPASLKIMIKG